jgi:carbonic anhydrase/acetyltransferase-like protein (isoleucine patch superfamily)
MTAGPVLLSFRGMQPRVEPSAFVAPGAVLIGDVAIAEQASVWYGCVLRGDVCPITVGARSNLQDGTVVHGSPGEPPTMIGTDVLVGHAALVHGCRLEDGCSVGMRATVLNGAVVESEAQVAAAALVLAGTRVPSGELWGGVPARCLRKLSTSELADLRAQARHYVAIAAEHARVATSTAEA